MNNYGSKVLPTLHITLMHMHTQRYNIIRTYLWIHWQNECILQYALQAVIEVAIHHSSCKIQVALC